MLLVGDDPLARSGLFALLSGQPGLQVVGQADASELPSVLASTPAEVAAWDLGLAPRAELESVRDRPPGLKVVVLVSEEKVAKDALALGARGVLMREVGPARLGAALVAVGRGSVVVDEALMTALIPAREAASDAPTEPLTPRELEVLQLLAQGLPNKAIAARLSISEHTAKFHVNAIIAKLGAESRTEAVVRAARAGLVMI